MTLEVYQQIGFRDVWNFDSLKSDQAGDGVIFSPRFMGPKDIAKVDSRYVRSGIFDPQFFLPNTALGKLKEYGFFPDVVASGFKTSEYDDDSANESAERCVEYQINTGFRYVVIPTRYAAGMPTNLINDQQELFVNPFLRAIEKIGTNQEIILQLVLNDNMLKDAEYSSDLLNWVTGLERINGVYLIVQTSPRTKQLADTDLLFAMLSFVDSLAQNQLDVVLGYLNTESIILSLANPKIITTGIYENTRMFNIRNFEERERTTQQGPTARLYISKLLQWVDHRYIGAIVRGLPNERGFFDENRHQALMFQPSYRWQFQKAELYKHGLLVLHRQLRDIGRYEDKARYEVVQATIRSAMSYYQRLEDGGVVFDAESGGNHLPAWLTAANQFGIQKGWN
jgi:hypothetical protein